MSAVKLLVKIFGLLFYSRQQLDAINASNKLIIERLDHIMPTVQDELAVMAGKIDAAVTAIALELQTQSDKIKELIAAGTVTPADVDAALQPSIDRLTALETPPVP